MRLVGAARGEDKVAKSTRLFIKNNETKTSIKVVNHWFSCSKPKLCLKQSVNKPQSLA